MTIRLLHTGLANTVLLYTLIVAGWSFWLYHRRRDLGPPYWGALAINGLVLVVQVILGLIMVLQGRVPLRWVHYLYGSLAVITLPAAFVFTYGHSTYREALIYGVALLFLAGVALRATMTALGG